MIQLRRVIVIPTLMHWRKIVIREVFGIEPSNELMIANRLYYTGHIANGSHVALVASLDGMDCGCGGVCFQSELPSPDNPPGLSAYLMNIFVLPEYRHRGVASRLVQALITSAQNKGCGKIYLETTAAGKSLYRQLGFSEMQNMMKL